MSELEKLTAEFIESLKRFIEGRGLLTEAIDVKDQLFQHLRWLPGAIMLTDRGDEILARVQSAWKKDGDAGTAPELARNPVKMLQAGGKSMDEILFIDDTTTIFLDGEAIRVLDSLAYAILKVLYCYRPEYVKQKELTSEGFV